MHEVLLCPSWCEKKKGRRFGRKKHTKPTDKYLQGERRSLEDEEEEKLTPAAMENGNYP